MFFLRYFPFKVFAKKYFFGRTGRGRLVLDIQSASRSIIRGADAFTPISIRAYNPDGSDAAGVTASASGPLANLITIKAEGSIITITAK